MKLKLHKRSIIQVKIDTFNNTLVLSTQVKTVSFINLWY